MRKICTLYFLLFSVIGFTQNNNPVNLAQALSGRIGCGLVRANPPVVADTGVVIVSNCWGGRKIPADSAKKVNLSNGHTVAQSSTKADTGGVFSNVRIRCGGRRQLPTDNKPILILDGTIVMLDTLGKINPNEITSVEIIKSATATAIFGPDGVNGAIAVTTKKNTHWKVFVKDRTDNKPIPGATVQVRNKKKNAVEYLVANDSGFVLLDKKGLYDSVFAVSAIGFSTYTDTARIGLNNLSSTILLDRDTKVCEEVVVSTIACIRKISCSFFCRIPGLTIVGIDTVITNTLFLRNPKIAVYPNPAQRNSSVNIKIENATNPLTAIRVTSANGSPIHTLRIAASGKNNTLPLQTGNWPAGVYFIQVQYANGQPAASERLIIQ